MVNKPIDWSQDNIAERIMKAIMSPCARTTDKWNRQRELKTKINSFVEKGYLTEQEAEDLYKRRIK